MVHCPTSIVRTGSGIEYCVVEMARMTSVHVPEKELLGPTGTVDPKRKQEIQEHFLASCARRFGSQCTLSLVAEQLVSLPGGARWICFDLQVMPRVSS